MNVTVHGFTHFFSKARTVGQLMAAVSREIREHFGKTPRFELDEDVDPSTSLWANPRISMVVDGIQYPIVLRGTRTLSRRPSRGRPEPVPS